MKYPNTSGRNKARLAGLLIVTLFSLSLGAAACADENTH